jgi:hypothetical protein
MRSRRWTPAGAVALATAAASVTLGQPADPRPAPTSAPTAAQPGASTPTPPPGSVELRGPVGSAGGDVRAIDLTGVLLGDERGRRFLVGWDRVRSVNGVASVPAAAFSAVAADVWRARSRLERDDWRAAEPLFEQLFTVYRGARGPTAAVVAEGLLRCRLRRASQAAGVWTWLELVRIRRDQERAAPGPAGEAPPAWIGGEIDLRPIYDPATSLVAALPPVWLSERSLRALVDAPQWKAYAPVAGSADVDPVVAELASLYRAAAVYELEGKLPAPLDAPGAGPSSHPGVALVRDIVIARVGDDKQRADARKAMQRRIDEGAPRWVDVWCRVGIGRSLLMEPGDTERALGVVSLLHVPARFGEEYAALAGTALAQAAAALHAMGDEPGARQLVEELRRVYPTHPASSWSGLNWYAPAPIPSAAREP